jgi:hypothetical protein
MTDKQLNDVACAITATLYDVGARLALPPADLAAVAATVNCNVHFWAHGPAGVEHMRTAADVFERQLLDCSPLV